MLDAAHGFPSSPAALADLTADLVAGPAPRPYQAGDWPAPAGQAIDPPGADYAVLHVGASSALKLWPPERWQALAEQLQAAGLTPAWSAGPGEECYVEQIDPQRRYRRYCGTLTLAGLWQLLATARLLVCPDTGVAHLGKIVGTPTVALFGPGSASIYGAGEFWQAAPYRALSAEIACRDQRLLFRRQPDWVRRCGRNAAACAVAAQGLPQVAGASACMSAITLDAVLAACRELLAAPPKRQDAR
jgi:ADP-heptose:LPS heptosyltransferase